MQGGSDSREDRGRAGCCGKDTVMNTENLKHISPQEFAALGVQGVAYIKAVVVNGTSAYAIHAADGTQLALVPNREVALATVRQNELEPLSVH
jgi:hypothetical protein